MRTKRSLLMVAAVAGGAFLGIAGLLRATCSAEAAPVAKSEIARDPTTAVPGRDGADLVADNTRFALDAYRTLVQENGHANVVLSPYSISLALAMAWAGARGETATEMATAMRWALPPSRLHPAFSALDAGLQARSGGTLHTANSLWAAPRLHFEQPFLDTLARSYGAGVRLADFAGDPGGSARRINAWVSDETKHLIPQLLDSVARYASLVLVNAIHFRAGWSTPFRAEQTRDESFWRLDGNARTVPMMHADHPMTRCAQTNAYDAVEVPYAGEAIAMDIVMPKAGSLSSFEAQLSAEALAEVFNGMGAAHVDLSMPRFRIDGAAFLLKEMLQRQGMELAFAPGRADFSALGADPSGPLYIGEVIHRAVIKVDEEGTEAAAATALTFLTGAALREEVALTIRIDRPFLFFIRDLPTGTILFAGRVVDPSHH